MAIAKSTPEIGPPPSESTLKIDASHLKLNDLQDEFVADIRKIINRVNKAIE